MKRKVHIGRWLAVALALVVVGAGAAYWFSNPHTPTNPEAACANGTVVAEATDGQCCWPGQGWNGERCVGTPSECPAGHLVDMGAQACALPPCDNGMTRDSGQCCWPQQAWVDTQGRCVGVPACPEEFVPDDEDCLAADDEAWVLYTGCDAGITRDCVALAALLQAGQGIERSDRKAAHILEQACEGNSQIACYRLAVALRVGAGVDVNLARAQTLLRASCDQKAVPEACYDLATLLDGPSSTPTPSRGIADLMQKSCDAGYLLSCDALGSRYQHGIGVHRNALKAKAYFERSCSAGFVYSCTHLAWMLRDGAGVEVDVERAATLFDKACSGGEGLACGQLADLIESGKIVGSDPQKVPALRALACEEAWHAACPGKGDTAAAMR